MRVGLIASFCCACAITLVGCDRTQPFSVQPRRQMSIHEPDLTFRLSADQRAKLVPNIDGDAVEKLLQHVEPDGRDHFLAMFTRPEPGKNQAFQVVGSVGGDSTMNDLLEQIYAPTWIAWGADEIEHSDSRLPGRELARTRLGLKKPSRESK